MSIFVKLVFTPCCGEGDVLEFNVTGGIPSTWWTGPAAVWTYLPNPVNPLLEGCYFVERIQLAPGEADPVNPAPQNSEMTYVAVDCEAASDLDTLCNCTPCYTLTDCAGILEPINTQTDLSAYVGTVITLADDTNHEIDVCRLVEEGEFCFNIVEVAIYKCHDTCEDCLPAPLPPEVPCPRPVDPGYDTGLCDPNIVENIKCTFSEIMYQKMMSERFAIKFCCKKDEDDAVIKNEKISMLLRTSIDPESIECVRWNINIPPNRAIANIVWEDCFGNRQNYQLIIGENNECVAFCGNIEVVPTINLSPIAPLPSPQPGPFNGVVQTLRGCLPGDSFYSTGGVLEPAQGEVSCEQWKIAPKEIGKGNIEFTNCAGEPDSIPYDVPVLLVPRTEYFICITPNTPIVMSGGQSALISEELCGC